MFSFTNQVTEEKSQPVFTDTRAKWKARAALRNITSADIAALCIYRSVMRGEGLEGAESRLRKSFFPITNKVKLDNGAAPFGSLNSALWSVRGSVLYSWLTPSEQDAVWKIAQELRKEAFK
jgi:hypothetical protein